MIYTFFSSFLVTISDKPQGLGQSPNIYNMLAYLSLLKGVN